MTKKEDQGAELIHPTIPDMEGTEPRLTCRFGIPDACCSDYYRCSIRCYERQRTCVCGKGELHPDHDDERQTPDGGGHEFTEEAAADQPAASTEGEGGAAESQGGASAQSTTPKRAQDSRSPWLECGCPEDRCFALGDVICRAKVSSSGLDAAKEAVDEQAKEEDQPCGHGWHWGAKCDDPPQAEAGPMRNAESPSGVQALASRGSSLILAEVADWLLDAVVRYGNARETGDMKQAADIFVDEIRETLIGNRHQAVGSGSVVGSEASGSAVQERSVKENSQELSVPSSQRIEDDEVSNKLRRWAKADTIAITLASENGRPATHGELMASRAVADHFAAVRKADQRDQRIAQLEADLRQVDMVLDRRDALADAPTRVDKIIALLVTAKANDPRAELVKAVARAEAAEAALARPWQPIETAPKDGTRVLVWLPDVDLERGGYEAIAEFVKFDGEPPEGSYAGERYRDGWCNDYDGAYLNPDPTRWMPLPEPPR